MNRAYVEACRKGTKQVFNARIILAGYSGGGKTSLANRLLGEQINVDERHSTEGIALHRIESTFNKKDMKGAHWNEKDLNAEDLKKDFSQGLVAILRERSQKPSSESTGMGEKPEPQETTGQLPENGKEDVKTSSGSKSSLLKTRIAQEEDFSSLLDREKKEEMIALGKEPSKQDSEDSTPFSISLWDLGGQDEFISTHHLFLNIDATILIVMDITKGLYELIGSNFQFGYLNSVVDVLHYWLNLFNTEWEERMKKEENAELNIGLALTHKDKLPEETRDKDIEDYKMQILEVVKDKPYSIYLTREEIYVVDNSEETESNFRKLRDDLLKHLKKQKSWGKKMPLPWLSLKADIMKEATKKNQKHMSLEKIWKLAEQYEMNSNDVESFLEMQTTLGDFVYFQGFRETVITDPRWLVDKCKALISTHEFIDERKGLKESIRENLKREQVTEDDLKVLWNNEKVIFLTKLLEKFYILIDVSDETGHKYIIPCMLHSKFSKISQKEIRYKLLIGSFPQLVSKCSKVDNWKIIGDNLSFTTASFDIGKGMKLHMSLFVSGEVQTSIDWPEKISKSERDDIQGEVTVILSKILKTCRVQTNPDEGKDH